MNFAMKLNNEEHLQDMMNDNLRKGKYIMRCIL
jgi:hypothetical protein